LNNNSLFDNKKIMVIVAHPDDEILGLGGSMNRIINQYGAEVHVVILGEGLTSRADQRNTEDWNAELKEHRKNIYDASEKIGYDSVSIYNFPDNRFDSVDLLDLIKVIEKEKKEHNPAVIFTHHGGDVNIDHQRCFEAVITACRPMEQESVEAIITFETPSGTEWRASTDPRHFVPNFFIKITENQLMAKIKAMESYTFEKRKYPHPRSPEALRTRAAFWGNSVGGHYAEAFHLVRNILSL